MCALQEASQSGPPPTEDTANGSQGSLQPPPTPNSALKIRVRLQNAAPTAQQSSPASTDTTASAANGSSGAAVDSSSIGVLPADRPVSIKQEVQVETDFKDIIPAAPPHTPQRCALLFETFYVRIPYL